MHIDAIDIYLTKNPLIKPWKTAYGEDPDIWSVLVKMTSGADEGWGEACPLYGPTYSPECAWGVFYVMKEFMAPMIIGRDFSSPEEINAALAVFKANPFAKSGLEMAWWALEAKRKGLPLHEMFGGKYDKVPAGADFGVQDSYDTLIRLIDGALKAGHPRIKLKAMPGWDLEMLKAVRSTFPKDTFHIDCNSGYTLDALPLFKEIDKLGLAMIEQPLFHADLVDHAKLQAQMDTPICLDESLTSIYAAEKAIELGSCRIMNLKPGRLGGLSTTLKVNKMAEEAGIGCWVGSMLETAVGASILVELATCSNLVYPGDLFLSDNLFPEEICDYKIALAGPGYTMPSKTPGNPCVPDPVKLKARTHASAHLE